MELLSLKKVSVIYGNKENAKTVALENVNLTINKGEFVTIQGKSGCGKTTLLNVLGGIIKPMSGEYDYVGVLKGIQKMSCIEQTAFRREHIGYVLQNFGLLDDLTIKENIEMPLIYQRVAKKVRNRQVEIVLSKLNINELAYKRPYQLSGGQKQRVAIARAIVHHPDLLLADEPTGSLDIESGKYIVDVLQQMNKEGITVVMVTHDAELASRGTRRIEMSDGKII